MRRHAEECCSWLVAPGMVAWRTGRCLGSFAQRFSGILVQRRGQRRQSLLFTQELNVKVDRCRADGFLRSETPSADKLCFDRPMEPCEVYGSLT